MKFDHRIFAIVFAVSFAVGTHAQAPVQRPASTPFANKQVSDDLIYDNVKRRLAEDSEVKGGGLDIDVKEGIVTLRGKLETQRQIDKAAKLAKKVNGVKKVVNEIQLTIKQ